MDKLIELLNEREIGEEGGELYYLSNGVIRDDGGNILYDYRIISKQFGFIKWLVDNDKINFEKLEIWLLRYGIPEDTVGFYEGLLMLLAIDDKPIEFLISILK